MKKTTAEKIRAYLRRAATDEELDFPPLEQKGIYEIISGTKDEWGGRSSEGIYEGRFIDVVVKAVNMPAIGGWYLDEDDIEDSRAGYIKKKDIKKVEQVNGIIDYLNNKDQLERDKANLEARIEELNKKMEGYA